MSDDYQWPVVSGARARLKGSGQINGSGHFGFLLTAIDGELSEDGGGDRFRFKGWDRLTDEILYDDEIGIGDDEDPTTTLLRGKITIHKWAQRLDARAADWLRPIVCRAGRSDPPAATRAPPPAARV